MTPDVPDAARALLDLIATRADDATICPSEVARILATESGKPDAWRASMPMVHAAVDSLLSSCAIRLSWKGAALARRSGPYRIARSPA